MERRLYFMICMKLLTVLSLCIKVCNADPILKVCLTYRTAGNFRKGHIFGYFGNSLSVRKFDLRKFITLPVNVYLLLTMRDVAWC